MKKKIILASASPRRQQLLSEIGITYEVVTADIDEENFPAELKPKQVPAFLAEKKAEAVRAKVADDALIIAADTIVVLDKKILGKPTDREDAIRILNALSENMHSVITGVCILDGKEKITFSDRTDVHFRALTAAEIEYYVDHYKPYDKAGAYAIQEWLGMVGILRIEGDYFNVMGLPVNKVYTQLKHFIE